MKKRVILILFHILITSFIFSQSPPKYWKAGNQYTFEALFLDENDKILTNETVTILPTGKIWELDNQQTLATFVINFSHKDSVLFASQSPNGVPRAWHHEFQEGVIENAQRVWMHPIRHNQYKLTEVAPFPEVKFPLEKGNDWSSWLEIGEGWGSFQGKVTLQYKVEAIEARTYACGTFKCWKIVVSGMHNKLGESIAVFYFNEELGFTEMDYTFYNKQKIQFRLKDFKM